MHQILPFLFQEINSYPPSTIVNKCNKITLLVLVWDPIHLCVLTPIFLDSPFHLFFFKCIIFYSSYTKFSQNSKSIEFNQEVYSEKIETLYLSCSNDQAFSAIRAFIYSFSSNSNKFECLINHIKHIFKFIRSHHQAPHLP